MWNSIKTFIESPETKSILQLRTQSQKRAKQAGFNVCSFVSIKAPYENFHSDIIAALLDPEH